MVATPSASSCPTATSGLNLHPATVLHQQAYGSNLFKLTLQLQAGLAKPQPFTCQAGQFVMLQTPANSGGHFGFNRPFSPLAWCPNTQQLTVYYKVLGQGTQALSTVTVGQHLQVLGPLGQPYASLYAAQAVAPQRQLLIGGGIGVVPLVFQLAQWQEAGIAHSQQATLLFGARYGAELGALAPELQQLLPPTHLQLWSDDGTVGHQGTTVDALQALGSEGLAPFEQVLLCGPNPMMAACVRTLEALAPQLTVYVSLENHMPCGTGACFGCVVPAAPHPTTELHPEPYRVCLHGPVFNAKQLLWSDKGPATSAPHAPTCYPSLPTEGG